MSEKTRTTKETKKEIRRTSRVLLVLSLFLLVAITAGVSYAFFTYTKLGSTENTITTGTITFLYDEQNAEGNGISISDALPTSDADGKVQTGANNTFDFKVTATTSGNSSVPYEVTARKKATSDLTESAIKLYLTEVVESNETDLPLTINGSDVKKYSELTSTTVNVGNGIIEKTIYQGTVSANSTNYAKNFRLRMWIADDVDYSPTTDDQGNDVYPYNGKTFAVTINVYANATVITSG